MIGEAFGDPDQVAWLMGVENDFTIAYILIQPHGAVTPAPGGCLKIGGSQCAAKSAVTLHHSFWAVDGGGGTVNGENGYTLEGTPGQPDTGWSEQGDYRLVTSFWSGCWRIPAPSCR